MRHFKIQMFYWNIYKCRFEQTYTAMFKVTDNLLSGLISINVLVIIQNLLRFKYCWILWNLGDLKWNLSFQRFAVSEVGDSLLHWKKIFKSINILVVNQVLLSHLHGFDHQRKHFVFRNIYSIQQHCSNIHNCNVVQ